ncbi:ASCH domain-containing protein [Streptomyces sp. 5.8]|uniref:ASCH domain-containing protein n=1 Tax=Streptomyces sp. 5.8 TaxID=3406571 RepID=UPI003BB584A9
MDNLTIDTTGPPHLWRCLTIHNPWAELIIRGDRAVEIRTWTTGPRRIWVHAAKHWEGPGPRPSHLTFGAVVGSVQVVRCSRTPPEGSEMWAEDGDNLWYWHLADPRPLSRPVPMRGRQSLYAPDPAVMARLIEEA